MSKIKVKKTHQDTDAELSFQLEVGSNIADLAELYGTAVVYSHALSGIKTAMRNKAGSLCRGPHRKPAAECKRVMAAWKPCVIGDRRRQTAKERLIQRAKEAGVTASDIDGGMEG